MYQYLFVCKASELVAVKSKADEIISQKTALDDHIATLKVTFYTSHTGRRRITWMKTVLNDLESHNLTLTEAVNMAQNRPLWTLEVAGCEWHCALLVMQARNDGDSHINVHSEPY